MIGLGTAVREEDFDLDPKSGDTLLVIDALGVFGKLGGWQG